MAMINVQYRVDLIESERGWGQRVDETKYFDELDEANAFVTQFNSKNDKDVAPDWYMYATQPEMVQVKPK
jgi:vacuolar-type H+-ATPase subunit C/Vma6